MICLSCVSTVLKIYFEDVWALKLDYQPLFQEMSSSTRAAIARKSIQQGAWDIQYLIIKGTTYKFLIIDYKWVEVWQIFIAR